MFGDSPRMAQGSLAVFTEGSKQKWDTENAQVVLQRPGHSGSHVHVPRGRELAPGEAKGFDTRAMKAGPLQSA